MKYYAVIDTNVLVSAMLKWDSVPGGVLQLVFGGTIVPLLTADIVAEYRKVLARPKFGFRENIIDDAVGELERLGISVDASTIDENIPDVGDRKFYEVVMEERKSEDAYLVTGNIRHFPVKPFVVTPRQMIDIILKDIEK